MRPYALSLLALFTAVAAMSSGDLACAAEPFAKRIEAGRAAEQESDYPTKALGQVGERLAQTMAACFADTANASSDPFVLVADVSSAGAIENVEVQPSTNVATCFANGFSSMTLSRPPQRREGAAFPLWIEMAIK